MSFLIIKDDSSENHCGDSFNYLVYLFLLYSLDLEYKMRWTLDPTGDIMR